MPEDRRQRTEDRRKADQVRGDLPSPSSCPLSSVLCPLFLAVQVLLQLGGVQFDLSAVLGHIHLGAPQDRILDQPAEILVAPVLVRVAASEAEAPAAVGALMRPGDDLLA